MEATRCRAGPRGVATRATQTDDGRAVTVEIHAPEPDPDSSHGDWRCPFRLHGALDVTGAGYGVDALQALIHATQAARKAIDDSGLSLTWMGGEAGDHGIPAIVPQMFGRAFARSIEEEIERRLAAHRPGQDGA